ncbi:C-type lectin-like protein [Cheloniid poxvirus 1]|nr:C-type lectin-like protein [Cheloniid poxvirus 1]
MKYIIKCIILAAFIQYTLSITCRYGYSEYNGKCWQINKSYKSRRSEAQTKCIYAGGYLARHLDDKDKNYLDVFTHKQGVKLWIGLSYKAAWDGSEVLKGVVNGPPMERCIYIQSKKYYSTNCNDEMGYVCMQR